MLNKPRELGDIISNMDYDAVSGPQVKRIKNLQLHSVEEVA